MIIAAIIIVMALSDCPRAAPGFEWLLGVSCAAVNSGSGSRQPDISVPDTSNPPGGSDPGGPGKGKGGGNNGNGKGK